MFFKSLFSKSVTSGISQEVQQLTKTNTQMLKSQLKNLSEVADVASSAKVAQEELMRSLQKLAQSNLPTVLKH